MSGESSIDDIEDFDSQFGETKRTIEKGFLGCGIGFVVGFVGGIYLGESINNYFEILKEAPPAIHYAVDVGVGLICSGVGAGVGSFVGALPGAYRIFKDL